MQNIFLVVGSCPDSVVLNGALPFKGGDEKPLECWAPDGTLYLGVIKDVAGNIVEIDGFIRNGAFVKEVPVGSLVCFGTESSQWFVSRYYSGVYNDMITNLMKEFGITDYKLPHYRGRVHF